MSAPALPTRVAVVIDDDPAARALLAQTLERASFEVHAAPTGAIALELVERHSPTVTVVDVDGTDAAGFTLTQQIRALSETYLLVLSSNDAESDMLNAYDCGADCFLPKPFRPLELRARVEAMLRRPR